MGDRLATIDMGRKDMGRKLGAVPPFWGAGSPSNNVARTEAYHPTKWHLDPSSRLAQQTWPIIGEVDYAPLGEGGWVPI